jgi:hypothetical protein
MFDSFVMEDQIIFPSKVDVLLYIIFYILS